MKMLLKDSHLDKLGLERGAASPSQFRFVLQALVSRQSISLIHRPPWFIKTSFSTFKLLQGLLSHRILRILQLACES